MEIVERLLPEKSDHKFDNPFAMDVFYGLKRKNKTLPSKYFYDDSGSKIFQEITQHPDYYPTKTELEILKTAQHLLPAMIAEKQLDVIELGAGDGHKTQFILNGFLTANCQVNYYPIDISRKAMDFLENEINPHPKLLVRGIVDDYFSGLASVRQSSRHKKLVLFLGSNIGNFDSTQSLDFLSHINENLEYSDYMLIGFDLKKDINTLTAAYNDSSGLTRNFNLNLLKRINRELGANFNLEKFHHHGIYNPTIGAMESHLISTEKQSVKIQLLDMHVNFDAFEAIHTEYSYKYSESDIETMSRHCGFSVLHHFTDDKHYFIDSLWKKNKTL